MGNRWNRRDVVRVGVAAGAGILGTRDSDASPTILRRSAARPLVISSSNGLDACRLAMERIRAGEDALDAVVAGVNLVEEDPDDTSVGYGGLPNEDGVVQLDASVMHGPDRLEVAVPWPGSRGSYTPPASRRQ